jgi:hypothetical protein
MATDAPHGPVTGADLKACRLAAGLPKWAVALAMRTETWHVANLERLGRERPTRRMVARYLDAIAEAVAARDGNDGQ